MPKALLIILRHAGIHVTLVFYCSEVKLVELELYRFLHILFFGFMHTLSQEFFLEIEILSAVNLLCVTLIENS